jgi:PAP2 superfamily
MSDQIGTGQQTVEDVLARRLEARRGASSPWTEALRELGAIDRAVYQAVADTPSPELDRAFRRLSTAADHSRVWFGIAAAMALLGGSRGRRAAFDGLLAISTTSAAVNLGIKPFARRPRPTRAEPAPFVDRYVPMPKSTSFPSGHAASAFAFAYAVARDLPRLAVPVGLLAGGGPFASSHRRALSERRGDRLHSWSRDGRDGDSCIRCVAQRSSHIAAYPTAILTAIAVAAGKRIAGPPQPCALQPCPPRLVEAWPDVLQGRRR